MEEIRTLLSPKDFKGETVLVTAGPTEEPIDPVRFISNRSSGKMGFALARAARRRGAEVLLISGPTALPLPPEVKYIPVRTTAEMREAVLANLKKSSVLIMAAAVSDYRPKETSPEKIKKSSGNLVLPLELNPDILSRSRPAEGEAFHRRVCRRNREPFAERPAQAGGKESGPHRGQRCFPPGGGFCRWTRIS